MAGIDSTLTEDGIISPGLGDAVGRSSEVTILTDFFYRETVFSTQLDHEEN